TALILSRQNVPTLHGTAEAWEGVRRGGYVLQAADGATPDVVLVGTGSEAHLCVEAAGILAGDDGDGPPLRATVVSLPSWELFAEQDEDYRAQVLPRDVPKLAVEAAASFGWDRYVDDAVAIDHFGASAPGTQVLEHLGFTAANVAGRARQLVARL